MKTGIRITIDYYNRETNETIESNIISDDVLTRAEELKDLGYRHYEQIELLQSIQDFKIKHQSILYDTQLHCPHCGKKSQRAGIRQSRFHAPLTDHRVHIQRRTCPCGWSSPYTVEGIYGSAIHPDLLEKQALQAADQSYRKASNHLNAECAHRRSVNSVESLHKNLKKVALAVGNNKLRPVDMVPEREAAKELLVMIDGGHLKTRAKDSRSFEAMITTVYRPENIRQVDKHHNKITQKTSVASALSDQQETIKTLAKNACIKEGASAALTHMTCLTDGASNCWSIAKALKSECLSQTLLLDWFHITKRFTILNNRLNEVQQEQLERVKWHVWHGDGETALSRLTELMTALYDQEKAAKDALELHDYLERNRPYLSNYQERHSAGLHYTSTLAEVTVDCLINTRQKRSQKMQWTREGAHDVLQIRTSLFSESWERDWSDAQAVLYKKAA